MLFGVSSAAVMPDYERLSPVTKTIYSPLAVAMDQAGRLYVAESSSDRIVILSQSGNYLSTLPGLHAPISVAVDSNNGRILTGSKAKGNVEVYDTDFTPLFKLGSGDGEFSQPDDICVASTGRIYVVDRGYDRIMMYESSGRYIGSFGSPGNGDGQFHRPISMTIDETAGEIIVLDRQLVPGTSQPSEGARVQFFNMTGTFLRGFTRNGNVEGGMLRPQGITVDGESRIYVTDSYQNAVLVYDSIGTFLGAVYDLVDPMRIPLGITLDATNRLYVVSRMANRIEVYGIDQYTGMVVDPVKLKFTAQEAGENPASQSISISNSGNTNFNWGTLAKEGWLSLADEHGVLESAQVATTDVAVDITGLEPGKYTGSIVVSAGPGATEVVQVDLTVAPSAILSVTSAGLAFASETGTAPATGTVTIANSGFASMTWSISADQSWLEVDQASGILANSGVTPETVTVTADVIGLAAGTYTGSITVTGYDAVASPVSFPVSLTLTEPTVVEPPTPEDRVFDDMTWNLRETLPPTTLNGVWAGSGSQVYAVGQGGAILSYDSVQASLMDSRTDRDLYGVWGCFDPETSTVDVFAVGAGGTILHYNNDGNESNVWTVMESSGNNLTGVWGTSATDVFAVGLNGTVLHYNGTNWSSMDSGTRDDLHSVWGSFDAGTNQLDAYAVGQKGTILYYDGVEWSNVESRTKRNLYGVWGSSATDIYAVGQKGTILHSNGSKWNKADSVTKSNLNSIWGSSATDIYAVGSDGIILQYDGDDWSSMYPPVDRELHSVWGTWETGVFTVGQDLTLLYYDYNSWQVLMLMSSTEDLYSVWGRSATDVFSVGLLGSILHYDGEKWLEMSSSTKKNLYSVWGRLENNVFAVGASGTILQYNESTGWNGMKSPTRKTLYGVWGTERNNIFAVGQYGTVLHYNEGIWNHLRYRGKNNLYSVWSRSSSDSYIVGQRGTILHYNGSVINSMPSPTDNDLYGIRGCSDTGLFAVGQGGTFLQYVNSSWLALDSGTNSNLYDVWCSSETDVFLVGQGDTLLYYDGSIQSVDFGTGGWLRGIWGDFVTTDVFAVGANGLIHHGKQ